MKYLLLMFMVAISGQVVMESGPKPEEVFESAGKNKEAIAKLRDNPFIGKTIEWKVEKLEVAFYKVIGPNGEEINIWEETPYTEDGPFLINGTIGHVSAYDKKIDIYGAKISKIQKLEKE